MEIVGRIDVKLRVVCFMNMMMMELWKGFGLCFFHLLPLLLSIFSEDG
jgi:hypothetical protein